MIGCVKQTIASSNLRTGGNYSNLMVMSEFIEDNQEMFYDQLGYCLDATELISAGSTILVSFGRIRGAQTFRW